MSGRLPHDALVRRFADTLARSGTLAAGERVAVAVSGGADSVALFRLLAAVAPRLGLQLAVAHFDHAWRADSAQDAAFVAELASTHQCPFRGGRALSAPARDREQQARRARHAFFTQLIQEGWADSVATAHTADDQAETVLLRLLRGTSPAGLAGILPRLALTRTSPERPRAEPAAGGIVRPLLGFRRAELRAWLCRLGQPWREDATNLDLHHRRNLLRQRFLPGLAAAFNPALVERLSTLAEVARGEEEFWTAYIAPLWRQMWQPGPSGGSFSRPALAAQPIAVQRRLLRATVRHLQGDVRRLDAASVERLTAWLADGERHPRRGTLAFLHYRLSARKLEFTFADRV